MTLRLYGRFSPRRDANECESCDNQIIEQRQWALAHHPGVPCVQYVDEDASGKSTEGRADFLRMIAECEKGDIVVVRNLERFSRNFEDTIIFAAQLRQRGVKIYSLESGFYEEDHNRAQKLLSVIRSMMAEWEREDKAKATKKAMQKKVLRGEYTGGRPQYGYDKVQDGTRITDKGTEVPKYKGVPNEVQMQCISYIMAWHQIGRSVEEMLAELNRSWRHAQPPNSVFTKKLISRIIDRENKRSAELVS